VRGFLTSSRPPRGWGPVVGSLGPDGGRRRGGAWRAAAEQGRPLAFPPPGFPPALGEARSVSPRRPSGVLGHVRVTAPFSLPPTGRAPALPRDLGGERLRVQVLLSSRSLPFLVLFVGDPFSAGMRAGESGAPAAGEVASWTCGATELEPRPPRAPRAAFSEPASSALLSIPHLRCHLWVLADLRQVSVVPGNCSFGSRLLRQGASPVC
jgi:hypothetical protein